MRILKQADQWPFRCAAIAAEPRRGFVAVDVQNDFVNGSLPVPGGEDVANGIGKALRGEDPTFNPQDYHTVVSTQDWHHNPTGHFAEHPDFATTWPQHGVAGTPGAELHPGMKGARIDRRFYKGHNSAAYSGFEGVDGDPNLPTPSGMGLADYLHQQGITDLDVGGLATDYCVKATALDAAKNGFKTRVLLPYSAGVNPETTKKALDEMRAAGIELVGAKTPQRVAGCEAPPFAEFMQWAIDHHRKPDLNSLHEFAQVSDLNTEDYGNLTRFMEGF